MSKYNRAVEEQIRRAIENGEFDSLPGIGKPLELGENPHEHPTWRMAFQMLRSSGYTLSWIETRREIEESLEKARKALTRSWDWRNSAMEENQDHEWVEAEWQRAVESFCDQINDLNQQIFSYNLEVPYDQFQRRRIDAKREIELVSIPPKA